MIMMLATVFTIGLKLNDKDVFLPFQRYRSRFLPRWSGFANNHLANSLLLSRFLFGKMHRPRRAHPFSLPPQESDRAFIERID